jgi:heme exporter protein D
MQAISDFLAMGGYAGFVWPAFLLSLALLAGLWIASARSLKVSDNVLGDLNRERPEQ